MDKWYVGVDIGGTTIKLGFVTEAGEIVTKWEIPTDTNNGGRNITIHIGQAIKSKCSELNESYDRLQAIGVGAPGFIEMKTGFIYQAVNIGWKDFALKDELEKETAYR